MIDAYALFDNKTAVAGGNFNIGTVLCAKSYDTGAVGTPNAVGPGGAIGGPLLHDLGRGRRLQLMVQITTTCVGVNATVSVDFICDTDEGLATSKTVLMSTAAIVVASLVAGYRFAFGHTPGKVPKRYVGVQYNVATTNLSAGAFFAALVLDMDDHADSIG